MLRAALVLARIPNLPTVWSDCLAAWVLAGGGGWWRLAAVGVGGSLLYTGGMFLNDAFDIEFDRRFRPERPIIAGLVRAREVWIAGTTLLVLGWLMLMPLGKATAAIGFSLLALIGIYDAIHKRTAFAPVLMAGCRLCLYLVAGSAATAGLSRVLVWRGAALGGYILGLSYVARGESTADAPRRWPLPLLISPLAVALVSPAASRSGVWLTSAGVVIWLGWCLSLAAKQRRFASQGVAGLLAGIVLMDWLAASSQGQALAPVFVGLFCLALLLQRVAPAT